MKHLTLLLFGLLLSATMANARGMGQSGQSTRAESNGIDYENWMSNIDDNLFLARLSIPGSHDACTSGVSGSAHTQTFPIEQQLLKGVRMFDLRPRWDGSNMYIYHGIEKTSVKFNDALNALCSFLDNHPDEFLFVIMRHEDDGASSSQKNAWPAKMYDCLNAKRSYIIDYSPTLTVKDLRGKILVMSRSTYDNGPIGAYLEGGGDNSVYDRIIVGPSGASMNTRTQDMYKVAGNGELDNKVAEIRNLLDLSVSENEYRLYFNHTSGYSKTFFGISTAAGVQECAQTCNKAMVDYMQGKCGPMGFIMMDFAGDDSNNYYGQTLIDLIIANNYNLMARERDDYGNIVKDDKTFILPMGADCEWVARYVRKDANPATEAAVDALSAPATGWMNTDFDDSSWAEMSMPLASKSYNAPYRTQWDGEYNCYWIRRTFQLEEVNASSAYNLVVYHDDDYKIYINGHIVNSANGWTNPGAPVIKEINKRHLNAGKNVIAIMNQQNWGGAYSDCGIYEVKDVYDGIESVSQPDAREGKTYNLHGIEVGNTAKPGLYIRNGKTVLIK